MIEEDEEWESIYRDHSLEEIPWHEDEPDLSLVTLLKNKNIKVGVALDVCSGAGTNSIYLAKKGFDVTGIDISETATKIAEQRTEKAGVSKSCKFYSGDILKIELPKNKFNFVFDRGCYHHISKEDKPRFAKIINDYLKKGGKYYLICFSDKNPPWEKNVTKDEIRQNFGPYFEIGEIKNIPTREKTGRLLHFYHTIMNKK
ncbi:MAG: class I SAM-dependent methyltransferase [Thermoplasmatales archaeon]|nr:MAG: class I SAM-dependent methyltransferase [Thermoplasmatales archaeon]